LDIFEGIESLEQSGFVGALFRVEGMGMAEIQWDHERGEIGEGKAPLQAYDPLACGPGVQQAKTVEIISEKWFHMVPLP
jgi:hypothetical protein